ncbi:heat shock protein 70, putative [Entamoeba histolytica HM-1:IMSS-B]|uniref:Heat shock protein 70, putative n=4 Tax=Entamoeba histolytica TaxID=5759 RepID=C4M8K8_ENTH1|nr:heat shock protein 70, putative [Entamoeba histolytica HM-1:IMSS]EAL45447.1 heat shock protein 70, putative [Entamoeba histolytica HM-1:IMSS]EMH76273.1 heat shock protein 70, putative [Entamoeba histolytica HM-1:IMSS-B]ENY65244.1 heat shock protein 70, putative [Entamoeba histolytica HM-1:IMSS-A]GAT97945.1 heat shock protein 70 putative [Entamoeba histolytica]|eukprot:XP_650833.1 heat shock protein 70, putative [Entamoeba histolytica HM-1:IMSS]
MPIAVGIDIGNRNITVAVVRKKGIDIVVNEVSNRQTPTFVSFNDKERAIGEAGFSLYLRNVKNTVVDVKRLIGRQYDCPDVQTELKELPYQTVKLEDGMIGMKVMMRGEQKVFRPEQIIAMLLIQIKQFTEEYTKDIFTDCVISVPGYFTENQRIAMLDAAKIAGISCLRLMNEHTATALAYGIYKTDLSETEPRPVVILDVGHCNTTCSVISLLKSKMKVLAVEYNWKLGGRNYDEALGQFVRADIQQKWKIDPMNNLRMWNRILSGIEKSVKRVISSGSPKAILNLDTLYEERDYHMEFTREKFDELTCHLNNEIIELIKRTITKAGMTIEQIHSIEITGSGTRLNTLQDAIVKTLNKPLSKTINCEESIARGCAIACAELQPYFKVRDYVVEDIPPYEINMGFKTDNKTVAPMKFISKDSSFPITRVLKIKDANGLHVDVNYSDNNVFFPGTLNSGITLDVLELPKAQTKTPELKLRIALNKSGILELVDALLCEQVEEEVEEKEVIEVPEEVKEEPKAPVQAETEKKEEPKAPVQAETEKKEEPKKMEEEKPKEEKKVKMVKKTITKKVKKMVNKEYPVKVNVHSVGMCEKDISKYLAEEAQMQVDDKLFIDTAHAKNNLEAFVYSMKDKLLFGCLAEFTTEEEASKISNELEKYVDWLYEDGENETKSVYLAKLAEAEKLVKHIVAKKEEKERKIAEEKRKKEEEEKKKKAEEEAKKKAEEEKKKTEEKPKEESKKMEEEKTGASEPPPVPK